MGIFPSLVPGATVGGAAGVGLGLEAIGAAGQIAAGIGQYSAQQGIFKAEQNVAADQAAQARVNYNSASLAIRRNQLQEIRNAQTARANALQAGVNQGAQFGSGVAGGMAQASDQASVNLLGLNQAKSSLDQSYVITQDINAQQRAMTGYQSNASMWQGIGAAFGGAGNLGGSLVSAGTNPSGAQQVQS